MPWFSTKGQLAQLLVGILGTFAALANAWPAIRDLQLLSWSPLVFYAIVTLFAASLIYDRKNEKLSTYIENSPEEKKDIISVKKPIPDVRDLFSNEPEIILALRGGRTSVSLKKGDYWRSGKDVNELKVVFHGIDNDRAELEFVGFMSFVGGSLSGKKGDHILLPDAKGGARAVAFVLSFAGEGYFAVDLVGVDHLNGHAQEVSLFVIRCRAYGDGRKLV